MKRSELIGKIKETKEKREAAFLKMNEEFNDNSVKLFNNLVKVEQELRKELCALEADENGNPYNEAAPIQKLTETQLFVKKLREAVAIGQSYTALVPTEIQTQIEKKRYAQSQLRKFVSSHAVGGNYTITVEGNGVTVGYVSEASQKTDSTPTVTTVTLNAYNLYALVKMSNESIEDPAVDLTEYISQLIAKGFALKEDREILLGSGSSSNNITGVITALTGKTARTKTTAAADAISWAEIKTFLGSLKAYKPFAIVVMSQATADYIQEFKDDGKYMFDQTKTLENINGVKVVISPDMSDIAAGKTVMVAGDFSYYHWVDRKNLEITTLKEIYATNGQVGIMATQRADGNITNEEAFAILNMKTV